MRLLPFDPNQQCVGLPVQSSELLVSIEIPLEQREGKDWQAFLLKIEWNQTLKPLDGVKLIGLDDACSLALM